MKLGIDAHCHLEYIENAEEVAGEVRKRMLGAVCSVPDPKDFDRILDLRKKFSDCIFVCLGFHPEIAFNYSKKERDDAIEKIKEHKKEIVGVGEVGLDYSWIKEEDRRKETKDIFIQFIDLAKEIKKPIVIHARNLPNEKERDAFSDCLKVLTDCNARRVVMHCFSGNENSLEYALEQEYWISYATIIVRSDKHKRLAAKTPLDRVLLETDSPWLDPDSRELVNRPWKIERSAEAIADLKDTSKEEVMKVTTENTKNAFGVGQ